MYGGNRIDDKAQLVTNSQEDDQEELSGARGSPDPVLVDLSDSSNARYNSLLANNSQHTVNSSSYRTNPPGDDSLLRSPSYHNQLSSTTATTTASGTVGNEHSQAEDDSYSSVDENKVMIKSGADGDDSDALLSSAEEELLQNGRSLSGSKRSNSFRYRLDSASSRLTRGSLVSVLGEERTGDNLITATQCMMHLLKGMIGAGLLALPYAFSLAGIVGGPLYMALICLIALVAMNFLVDANKHLCKVDRKPYMDYGELAECALRHGPIPFLRRHSHWGQIIVNILLILTQLGFCAVYFVFFATTVQSVMDDFNAHEQFSTQLIITFFLIPVVLLCLIRHLTVLALFSMMANVLLVIGITVIIYELFDHIPNPADLKAFETFGNFPLFFGTAIYSVEGIGLVLPLENKMKKPGEFKWVLNTGMLFVFLLYVAFGFLGYNKYHDAIQASISLNLPSNWYFSMTKVLFGLAMYVSYALQFVVPVRILMPWVNRTFPQGTEVVREYLFRLVLIMVTFIAAMAIPFLNIFIELLGSLASSSLALSLPAIIFEFSLYTNTTIPFYKKVIFRIFVAILLIVGVAGGIVGTVTAFEDIIKAFQAPDATNLIDPTPYIPNSTVSLAEYILDIIYD